MGSAVEQILDSVIRDQFLNIDVTSGAAVSSNCLLKSIEEALLKGMGEPK